MKYFACVFLYIILSTSQSTAQVNLANGLVTHLTFDGNSLDVSGNNNNGLPQNGIQLTTDRFGTGNSAYLFDGLNDHIIIRDQVGNFSSTPFSTVLWFQTQSNAFQVMIGKRDFGSTNGQQFQFTGYLPIDNAERMKALKQLEGESLKKNSTQIFIETPYRNNQMLETILKVCNSETKLCIAMDITSSKEWIKTKTIKEWRSSKPDLHKKPVVFLLLA